MPSYQWLRNGVAIPSATNTSYTLVNADDQTNVSVRYTPDSGSPVVSSSLFVTFPTPVFTDQPNSSSVSYLAGQVFEVLRSSWATNFPCSFTPVLFFNGVNRSNEVTTAQDGSFLWNITGSGTITFYIVATNSGGQVNSTILTVNVTQPAISTAVFPVSISSDSNVSTTTITQLIGVNVLSPVSIQSSAELSSPNFGVVGQENFTVSNEQIIQESQGSIPSTQFVFDNNNIIQEAI
jgi:hypothetical protein